MNRRIVMFALAITMFAYLAGAGVASASPPSVTPTAAPVLGGGAYDSDSRLKVYGGATAASYLTGSALYETSVTQRTTANTGAFRSYGYQWFRSIDGTSSQILIPQAEGGKGASYRATRSDVGYKLRVRMSVCYQDLVTPVPNAVCTTSGSTPILSWSAATTVVAPFASTAPVAAFVSGRPNQIKVTRGIWQGLPVGTTRTVQFEACTTSTGGSCTDITTGTSATGVNLTSASNNRYIRATETAYTAQGGTVTVTSKSNSLGYNIVQ